MKSKGNRRVVTVLAVDFLIALLLALGVAIYLRVTYSAEPEETPDLEIHPPIETANPTRDIQPIRAAAPVDTVQVMPFEKEELAAPVVEPASLVIEEAPEQIDYAGSVDRGAWAWAAMSMAKALYGEAPYCSKAEQAAVCWCMLNRVDDVISFAGQDTVGYVVSAQGQFDGYSPDHPVVPEYYELAFDVIGRWLAEKDGAEYVGRVLPKEYLYFIGDGARNYFTTQELGRGQVWDWSLPNPYE